MSFKVLVVDDDSENQAVIAEILGFNDIAFDIAEDGQQAVNMVQDHDYQLVFMDIMMPVMDGLEATKQIRELDSAKASVPIVAVSARRDLKAQAQWTSQGLNDFLTKPFTEQNLFAVIDKYR